jgi:hypothetical protein
MRKIPALAAACALAFMVGSARAAEVIGKVERNTILVDGRVFAISPTNTVGLRIDQLKEGDRVRISYSTKGKSYMKFNAMRVEKTE